MRHVPTYLLALVFSAMASTGWAQAAAAETKREPARFRAPCLFNGIL